MNRTYKVTGINLKATPLGETDRLLTLLTPERGLVRAVAQGARKHRSSLGGRSALFVVNNLLILSGRSLDKMIQADTVESFPGLSKNLGKLMAAQYLAELTLCQALSDQPQAELYHLLIEHLRRIEQSPDQETPPLVLLALLAHGTFHLLALAGLAPQVHYCCQTRQAMLPDFAVAQPQVGFSIAGGGVVDLSRAVQSDRVQPLSAEQLALLQQLTQPDLLKTLPESWSANFVLAQTIPAALRTKDDPKLASPGGISDQWIEIERLLRRYAQYHFEQPIRSATLIESCLGGNNGL